MNLLQLNSKWRGLLYHELEHLFNPIGKEIPPTPEKPERREGIGEVERS